ncbi:MAG: HindIII family type II restriction endonuclease [Chitinispirillia bacterium]|nr:HindIII family type II restriction endonuclease [Chitinispirillia bacterium]MCL2241763.1 HindIII family type II restriction endonuclease [Chitinispirillia bacterium]
MFEKLVAHIFRVANKNFSEATESLVKFINGTKDFVTILEQIGTIPEAIAHDSTEEKLFAKASDIVLSRAFREIGLKSIVINERADSADVQAESLLYGYTLVADAKAFRMSRTAKNQKDFKVGALSGWRKDANYAVLCAPYFQYPKLQSQIFAQSIENNVCLLSWEHIIFMIIHDIKECLTLNLSPLWNYGEKCSYTVVVADKKKRFLEEYNKMFLSTIECQHKDYIKMLTKQISVITERGIAEKTFWENEKTSILNYSKKQAIEELIHTKKIEEKIQQIEHYVGGLCND